MHGKGETYGGVGNTELLEDDDDLLRVGSLSWKGCQRGDASRWKVLGVPWT